MANYAIEPIFSKIIDTTQHLYLFWLFLWLVGRTMWPFVWGCTGEFLSTGNEPRRRTTKVQTKGRQPPRVSGQFPKYRTPSAVKLEKKFLFPPPFWSLLVLALSIIPSRREEEKGEILSLLLARGPVVNLQRNRETEASRRLLCWAV
jgi:hypothetical protein